MLENKYYKDYRGPKLTLAQIWKGGEERKDITDSIKVFYGPNNNWNGNLYHYEDIFPNKRGDKFYIEFHSENKRKHWFYGLVGEKKQIFNPPHFLSPE